MADCKDCKGTGYIPLFTSIAKCDACEKHKIADPLANKEKQRIISEYLKTPAGRARLAAAMTQPIRHRRDYNPIGHVGRKTFDVSQLPEGALPKKAA